MKFTPMNVFTFSTMLCFANMASSDSINGVRLETCLETVIFTIPIGTTRGVEISHCSLNLYKTKNKPHDIENGLLLLDKTDLLFWGPDVTKPNIVRNQYLYKKAPVCPKEVKTPGIFKHFTLHISQKQQHPFLSKPEKCKARDKCIGKWRHEGGWGHICWKGLQTGTSVLHETALYHVRCKSQVSHVRRHYRASTLLVSKNLLAIWIWLILAILCVGLKVTVWLCSMWACEDLRWNTLCSHRRVSHNQAAWFITPLGKRTQRNKHTHTHTRDQS